MQHEELRVLLVKRQLRPQNPGLLAAGIDRGLAAQVYVRDAEVREASQVVEVLRHHALHDIADGLRCSSRGHLRDRLLDHLLDRRTPSVGRLRQGRLLCWTECWRRDLLPRLQSRRRVKLEYVHCRRRGGHREETVVGAKRQAGDDRGPRAAPQPVQKLPIGPLKDLDDGALLRRRGKERTRFVQGQRCQSCLVRSEHMRGSVVPSYLHPHGAC
mmetsp:Transcript_71031/g.211769  ORF Transcript_71031/g.211769 Transcript_71031/m.211769 type:complete len:214 (-) Transcript_71031:619-1260(-)